MTVLQSIKKGMIDGKISSPNTTNVTFVGQRESVQDIVMAPPITVLRDDLVALASSIKSPVSMYGGLIICGLLSAFMLLSLRLRKRYTQRNQKVEDDEDDFNDEEGNNKVIVAKKIRRKNSSDERKSKKGPIQYPAKPPDINTVLSSFSFPDELSPRSTSASTTNSVKDISTLDTTYQRSSHMEKSKEARGPIYCHSLSEATLRTSPKLPPTKELSGEVLLGTEDGVEVAVY